jgi:hypothetical protein
MVFLRKKRAAVRAEAAAPLKRRYSISGVASPIAQPDDGTEWLNAIGQDSQLHETFGYYADPVDAGDVRLGLF